MTRLAQYFDNQSQISRRKRQHDAFGSEAAVEVLEPRRMLTAVAVAGAWNGGVFDHIGLFEDGIWQLDNDGDGFVDGPAFRFGRAGDTPITGDWDGDGFASVGVHRGRTFILDTNENRRQDANDVVVRFGLVGDTPVVGNWLNVGFDRIGVFRAGKWFLDVNGNGRFGAGDISTTFGRGATTALAGNWNTSPGDSIAVFVNGRWAIDRNENFVWDRPTGGDMTLQFGNSNDQPFTGDFLGDNTDEIAILQDPPFGDLQFFTRELSSFPGGAATAALAQVDAENETTVVTPGDDERREELFASSDEFLEV